MTGSTRPSADIPPTMTGIRRRDFANGLPLPGRSPHDRPGRDLPDGAIGRDPRALRGGNIPSVFAIGHWLRDRRLAFHAHTVRLAPGAADPMQGDFPIHDEQERYDVVVVGSGLSGLSAAFYLRRRRPGTRILILDAKPGFGGNAGRDDAEPIPTIAATGGAYAVAPSADFLQEFYQAIGLDWTAHVVPGPFYSYFFDDRTPYVLPGTRGWTRDVYGAGLQDVPYPRAIVADLLRARDDFRAWYARPGAPSDPADNSCPCHDALAHMTLHDYLIRERGWHPAVSDFYTRYTVDALAGTTSHVNAYTAISFLGAEYAPIWALPGGTSAIARHLLRWLIPHAIDGTTTAALIANAVRAEELDRPANAVRLRQSAVVLRADTDRDGATVVYFRGAAFHRVHASAVILAGQGYTACRLVEHLLDQPARDAWSDFTHAPVVCANVVLRRAAPVVDLGLGYNRYWWGSTYWADFVTADWVSPRRDERERPTVLTFYGGNHRPPEEMAHERVQLLTTPFSAYEASLRDDLNRVLGRAGFDFERDVSAVYLYRWGHGMIFPKPGFPHGKPQTRQGAIVRTPAARHIARRQIGRISFGGQDTESSPSLESAIASGLRTALEALALL